MLFNAQAGPLRAGGSSALGRRPYYASATNPVPSNTSGPFQFELNLDSPLANFGNLTRAQIANALLPRFYRVYTSNTERERMGFVGSVQYKDDRFEASVDGIYSKLTDQMDEFTFGVPVRNSRTVAGSTSTPGTGTNSGIIPLDVKIDQYNNLYGTFGNTSIIGESFFRNFETRFSYGIARAKYDVSDTLTLQAQGSIAKSRAWQSGNRIVNNIYGITTTYDPTGNVSYPTITSPTSFTDPANFRDPGLNFSLQREDDTVKSLRSVLDWTAVDTGDGLFVPVLRDVANRAADDLRRGLERMKADILARKIPPEELRGATITLSNFGTVAGRYAAPVVVPPQVAILSTGRIEARVVAEGGRPVVHRIMPLSLTFDHRVVTGGEAARFLAAVIADLNRAD